MTTQRATLIAPSLELEAELLQMAEEFLAAGEDRYKSALEDFPAFIRNIEFYNRGVDLPQGHVPASTFLLACENSLIGRSSFRHRLSPKLEKEGGHIGYDIRPSERRKGYGTLILKLTLKKAKELGLDRVLLTCDSDNIASARIIVKNGGKLHEQVISDISGKPISQYWIELM